MLKQQIEKKLLVHDQKIEGLRESIYGNLGLKESVDKMSKEFAEFKGFMSSNVRILISLGIAIFIALCGIFTALLAAIIKNSLSAGG